MTSFYKLFAEMHFYAIQCALSNADSITKEKDNDEN